MSLLRTMLAPVTALLLAAPALSLAPVPVAAQADDAFEQLYATLEAGVDQNAIVDTAVETVVLQVMQADPAITRAEADHPGFTRALIAEMRPVIMTYSERVRLEYRPRMVAAARELLSEEEARAVSAFYASPLGRRVLASASNNFQAGNVADDVVEGGQVSTDAVRRDLTETGRRGFTALSEEDQRDLMRQALTVPGLAKMSLLTQRVAPIRAEMESAPPNREELDEIIGSVRRVAVRFGLI